MTTTLDDDADEADDADEPDARRRWRCRDPPTRPSRVRRTTGDARPPEATASEPAPPDVARRRPPPGRISPGGLAAARGGASEGLAWLGRAPEAKASLLYRAVRLLVRFVCFGLFRFRIATSGQEHVPDRRLPARRRRPSRLDGPVRRDARPARRAALLDPGQRPVDVHGAAGASGSSRRIGGLLPVWRGGVGIDQHVASARAVVGNGAVFVQMPEGTVSGPPGRLGPMRTGWAIIALRTDAPILPLAMAGTEELYVGRRMASRILPVAVGRELAGLPAGAPLPAPGTREELDLARAMTIALRRVLGPVVEALHPRTVDPPDHPRRLRRRLTWLLLRPGRLDRDG